MLLALTAWTRAGASRAARAWMATGPIEQWMLERVVVLGMPLLGAVLLCASVLAAPWEIPALRLCAIGVLVILVIPTVYFILTFISIPGALFPRWAREVRRRRRQTWGT